MKLKSSGKSKLSFGGFSRPKINASKRTGLIGAIIAVTLLLIVWVIIMGQKAQRTIEVAVLNSNVYKNQVITSDMLVPYQMLQAEYEKLSIVNEDGSKKRRILLWEEADKVINSFAAYPIMKGQYAEYRSFIKSRIDNSDSVMYSFPGKEIVPLDIGANELKIFKTFLQPGDRLNVQAIFSEKTSVQSDDYYGRQEVEIFKTETVFGDIMIADLLNGNGESILDIYAGYNDLTVWQQAQLDSSASFKEKTQPSTLLVALTNEELETYYYYRSKSNVQFKVSLPQRNN